MEKDILIKENCISKTASESAEKRRKICDKNYLKNSLVKLKQSETNNEMYL